MEGTPTRATYDDLDSLSPYDVAILALTSPPTVAADHAESGLVTLACKEAYLWAGAIAHAVIRDPSLDRERIGGMLREAITEDITSRFRYQSFETTDFRRSRIDSYGSVVDHFLRVAGIWDERETVFRRTDDSVRSLIWRGAIEDPFTKRVRNILIGVVMTVPVSFTSTGPNDLRLDSLTWSYVAHSDHGRQQRELRVKTKELAEFVLGRIIPETVELIGKLAGYSDEQPMSDREAQIALAKRGYYSGKIDGNVKSETITAIRRYHQDNFLEPSGHLDPATKKRLRAE
ncbi:MAG TPA: peptidoglycan-binding domain-containing protein [Gemmatimonadaceae bacterium]